MAKKRKSKHKEKTKIVYRQKPETAYFGKETKAGILSEIKELEEKRKAAPSGFRGALQKMQINKAISERKALLGSARRTEFANIQTRETEQRIKLQEARNKLQELRKNQVDFSGFGFSPTPKKQIELKDLGL